MLTVDQSKLELSMFPFYSLLYTHYAKHTFLGWLEHASANLRWSANMRPSSLRAPSGDREENIQTEWGRSVLTYTSQGIVIKIDYLNIGEPIIAEGTIYKYASKILDAPVKRHFWLSWILHVRKNSRKNPGQHWPCSYSLSYKQKSYSNNIATL